MAKVLQWFMAGNRRVGLVVIVFCCLTLMTWCAKILLSKSDNRRGDDKGFVNAEREFARQKAKGIVAKRVCVDLGDGLEVRSTETGAWELYHNGMSTGFSSMDQNDCRNWAIKCFPDSFKKKMPVKRVSAKKPLLERPSRLVRNIGKLPVEERKQLNVLPGDVFINNVEMIDQERRPWCAVATAARILKAYGLDLSMNDLAKYMQTTDNGTPITNFELQMNSIGRHHDLDLMIVRPVTNHDSMNVQVNNYNMAANRVGKPPIDIADFAWRENPWDWFYSSQDPVVRQYMLDYRTGFKEAFSDNVITCIDNSDPLAWCCVLGLYDEPMGYSANAKVGSHMRMIIGYNMERDEILFTDSWGPGHELKRMDATEAMTITTGLYYYRDMKGE